MTVFPPRIGPAKAVYHPPTIGIQTNKAVASGSRDDFASCKPTGDRINRPTVDNERNDDSKNRGYWEPAKSRPPTIRIPALRRRQAIQTGEPATELQVGVKAIPNHESRKKRLLKIRKSTKPSDGCCLLAPPSRGEIYTFEIKPAIIDPGYCRFPESAV